LGGTVEALLTGTEGQRLLDTIEISGGKLILQEDLGGSSKLSKIWEYDLASDSLVQLAQLDPDRFVSGGTGFITVDEEASGVFDVTNLLGDSDTRAYLLTAQAHLKTNDPATVELGQLLLMRIDEEAVTRELTFGSGIDTYVRQARPTTAYGTATAVQIDGDAGLNFQALLAFTGLFGSGPGQIPLGATVTSAVLTLNTTNGSSNGASLYRMTTNWTDNATWSSLGNGVQVGSETAATADLVVTRASSGIGTFDVTASLNAWLSGAPSSDAANLANKGWVFIANGTDGWDFASFEGATSPVLTVTYSLPGGGGTASASLAAKSLDSGDGGTSAGPATGSWNPHDMQPHGWGASHHWDLFPAG
jgi:hypothetical protein